MQGAHGGLIALREAIEALRKPVKISWKGIEVDHRTLPLTERLYRYRDTSATPYHVAVAKNAIEVTISRVPTLTVKSGIGLSAAGIVCISLRANCVNFLATLNLQVILSVTVLRRILFGFALSQVFSFQDFTSTELRVFLLRNERFSGLPASEACGTPRFCSI